MLIAISPETKKNIELSLPLANRHGLVAGATGTGKTVTLQRLAHEFSRAGVPVFLADVKGDLSGIAGKGGGNPKAQQRRQALGLPPEEGAACPTVFWDLWGKQGHPLRTTVSEVGPQLFSRLLQLNEVQAGVLQLVFKIADDAGLLLLDLKDLKALLQLVSEKNKEFQSTYGNISPASVGAIQRGLFEIEAQGGDLFFGEPAFDVSELLRQTSEGQGYVNLLAAEKLLQSPKLYSTFLLWLMSELFEQLPEAGDLEKPKLVFFFDEAHLLFRDTPKALVEKIEQVVRLIRSKGVGIYFVTQSPSDLPETVLGQLGNRVQHALRAFTPQDLKAVKAAAQTMRPNPGFSAEQVIQELAVGEALVSVLDEQGRPSPVERAMVVPPSSFLGPCPEGERRAQVAASPVKGIYDQPLDRESAFEKLQQAASPEAASPPAAGQTQGAAAPPSPLQEILFGSVGPRGGRRDGLVQTAAKSAVRTMANQVGRELLRGLLGGLTGGSSPRRRR